MDVHRLDAGDFCLDDLFGGDEVFFADKTLLARFRVIEAFFRRGRLSRRSKRSADNQIKQVGENLLDLAERIFNSNEWQHFIADSEISFWVSPDDLFQPQIKAQIEFKFVLAALDEMRQDADLWYDYDLLAWQVAQRCIDEYAKHLKRVRRAIKFDRRNWHGRNRNQTKNRNILPVSISTAKSKAVA